ncbi:flavodoxin FldB [Gallaecimonas kandeliae]|uniref:flavodoxin FldB n=1 Tax=Gallaecimonas kandeliae TaxID=3029055 RepID=UPI00264873AC|nr:flavodoxin FldB [Gallaecimonas kandeliae]WKE66374.1 flavodoxin FldB [Gallaecimonas kandeliae]
MRIGLFYGSTNCHTEMVAEKIRDVIGAELVELNNLKDVPVALMADYDLLILGIPTWDFGQLQEDWEDQWDALDSVELDGKVIALFGMGDQLGYGDWFLDAMGILKEKLAQHQVSFIGAWPNQGYDFEASKALNEDGSQFVGLALDDDNQWKETDPRLQAWCVQILEEYAAQIG